LRHCALGCRDVPIRELWGQPDEAALKTGAEQMAKARDLAASPPVITQRGRWYIEALSAFYDPAKGTFQNRVDA
jgi:hypothetical protein